jgi:RHS repeat-associated protein
VGIGDQWTRKRVSGAIVSRALSKTKGIAKMYDPSVGRFLSEDPIAADVNSYRYVGNAPLSRTDSLGLATSDWISTSCPCINIGIGIPGAGECILLASAGWDRYAEQFICDQQAVASIGDAIVSGYDRLRRVCQELMKPECQPGECKVDKLSTKSLTAELFFYDAFQNGDGKPKEPPPLPFGKPPHFLLDYFFDCKTPTSDQFIRWLNRYDTSNNINQFRIKMEIEVAYDISTCGEDGRWVAPPKSKTVKVGDSISVNGSWSYRGYETVEKELTQAVLGALARLREKLVAKIREQIANDNKECKAISYHSRLGQPSM